MTCKHNWNFLDGLTKRIRCTRCEDTRFVNKMDEYLISSPHGKYTLADTRPNNIVFYDTSKGAQREVLRIAPEGVTSNPDVPVDEAAQAVIRALGGYLKQMVQKEYERGVVDGRQIQVQKEVERRMRNPATEDSSVAQSGSIL